MFELSQTIWYMMIWGVPTQSYVNVTTTDYRGVHGCDQQDGAVPEDADGGGQLVLHSVLWQGEKESHQLCRVQSVFACKLN